MRASHHLVARARPFPRVPERPFGTGRSGPPDHHPGTRSMDRLMRDLRPSVRSTSLTLAFGVSAHWTIRARSQANRLHAHVHFLGRSFTPALAGEVVLGVKPSANALQPYLGPSGRAPDHRRKSGACREKPWIVEGHAQGSCGAKTTRHDQSRRADFLRQEHIDIVGIPGAGQVGRAGSEYHPWLGPTTLHLEHEQGRSLGSVAPPRSGNGNSTISPTERAVCHAWAAHIWPRSNMSVLS